MQKKQQNELIRQGFTLVWKYRGMLFAHGWAIPPAIDAVAFAYTELAEVQDAKLRMNPVYSRNNAKAIDILDEFADCAIMLITALGPAGDQHPAFTLPGKAHSFGEMKMLMGQCTSAADEGFPWEQEAVFILRGILEWPGMDLLAQMEKRFIAILDRIMREKALKPVDNLLEFKQKQLTELNTFVAQRRAIDASVSRETLEGGA